MTFGVTPAGFNRKRLIDIKNQLDNAFIGEFGEINLDAQSVAGQIIGVMSKVMADIWENMEQVYVSQYPNSASGVSLDAVAALTGIFRLPATRTTVIGAAGGSEGALIPQGSLTRIPGNGEVFESLEATVISRQNSVRNTVQVLATAPQAYQIILDGISYVYSLPTIVFSGPFVSGNNVSIRVNGINSTIVPFSIDDPTTLNNLAGQLVADFPTLISSAVVSGNTIELTAITGKSLSIGPNTITGVGAPTSSTSFRTPVDVNMIASELALIIDVNADFVASSNTDTVTITAASMENPYSINVGSNLNITSFYTPVLFRAQNYGPIAAPANTLIEIVTPSAGWTSINNFEAGVTGRNQETDAELRLRRYQSLSVIGAATVEAIRARLLQQVAGVTSVLIFENITLTQSPLLVSWGGDFVAGNLVGVTVDGDLLGNVAFAGTHLATMNAIAALLETDNEIESATVQGGTNREILIVSETAEEVLVSFSEIGTPQPDYTISGGRPPKSFEAIVQGGSTQAIGDKIWQVKPAGIQTYGNTMVTVVDSMGNNQAIFFSRANPVYLWAQITLVTIPSGLNAFPANGIDLVRAAVVAYGNSLGIGQNVYLQRVQAAIFSVPGIISATVQLARTANENDNPVYSASDITISETEVSVWDINRVGVTI